jgi:hypothetical protein
MLLSMQDTRVLLPHPSDQCPTCPSFNPTEAIFCNSNAVADVNAGHNPFAGSENQGRGRPVMLVLLYRCFASGPDVMTNLVGERIGP